MPEVFKPWRQCSCNFKRSKHTRVRLLKPNRKQSPKLTVRHLFNSNQRSFDGALRFESCLENYKEQFEQFVHLPKRPVLPFRRTSVRLTHCDSGSIPALVRDMVFWPTGQVVQCSASTAEMPPSRLMDGDL